MYLLKRFIVIFLPLLLLYAFWLCPTTFAARDGVGQYLCEYGAGLYKKGHVFDAVHELKKALLADPDNACARQLLRKIFEEQTMLPECFKIPETACAGKPVFFSVLAARESIFGPSTYTWVFHDGTTMEGARISKTYERGGAYQVILKIVNSEFIPHEVIERRYMVRVAAPLTVELGEDIVRCDSDLNCRRFNFIAQTNSRNNASLRYSWDFGDGQHTEGRFRAAHTYKAAGNYIVKVLVHDRYGKFCSPAQDSLRVILQPLPRVSIGPDRTVYQNEEVSFNALSVSKNIPQEASYGWDFGDGTAMQGISAVHQYRTAGTYQVILTVDTNLPDSCSKATDTITVKVLEPQSDKEISSYEPPENKIPEVSIEQKLPELSVENKTFETPPKTEPVIQPEIVDSPMVVIHCAGKPIIFDARSSTDKNGDSLDYMWDFGDGESARGQALVTHAYAKGGTYQVRLTVDDKRGSNCSVESIIDTVIVNSPPQAEMKIENACCKGLPITFDASGSRDADNDRLTYSWSFGDGASAQGITAAHAYQKSGKYNVMLTVDDARGTACSSAHIQRVIEVNEEPHAVIKIKND